MAHTPSERPGNFGFLAEHAPLLADLGATAERLFPFDPASCVLKLRLLAESLTQEVASRIGLRLQQPTQAELLRAVDQRLGLDAQVRQMFHLLRVRGNEAAHQAAHGIRYREGIEALKVAREVALWFHRSFGSEPDFKPGPFILPDDPSQKLVQLQQQVAALAKDLQQAQTEQAAKEQLATLLAAQGEQERELATRASEERSIYESLADEASTRYAALKAEFDAKLHAVAAQPAAASAQEVQRFSQRAFRAAQQVTMDEAATRLLIDQMLRDAGWEADTNALTHANGARPDHQRNLAIAEWPTEGKQSADYVLFAGLSPLAAVEAKRLNINVAGKIGQAERYARGFGLNAEHEPAWVAEGRGVPWPDGQGGSFKLPFAYSCNGRPLIKQSPEASGTWFRDVRQASNLAKPLQGFHSPDGLLDHLRRSRADAEARLQHEGFAYLGLRDYQQKAIAAVESALAAGQTNCLLAMATGTGKTRTIIGLIYRLLKAERFRRILFLVDRTALGDQALDVFNEAPLEQSQPLSKIYNIAELGDMAAEAETRVQVATVQAMVKRIFASDSPPQVDAFDCVIVDEAHRGYTLDQDMTEGELALRDQAQYLSTYRRVLDYFDAVKVGLTATPARHTTEIFGRPVYTYSYREAVADDWLIDHEPPIRYQTLLSQHGIHFDSGQQVEAINLSTGEIESAELEDELHFELESFNKRVISEDFNRVICEQLTQELDPMGEEKTMIFCATDAHADMVKRLLGDAFKAVHGEHYNQSAVEKITGASDKVDQLIRRYKNERYPSIAITVDLLTTGIDVPPICHLVFMRRVKSRILYEQMIGRATRRCDEIGKTVFKIYDPVDLYATLQAVNTMQPLVKDPKVIVGDGEAETGPLAASWDSNKFLNPARDGAVLPILHLNGYKIANPTVLARIGRSALFELMHAHGYEPHFVEGDDPTLVHQSLAGTLDKALAHIQRIQAAARAPDAKLPPERPRWPMIVLDTPKGWTGPKDVDGLPVEGTWRAHQVPIGKFTRPEHVQQLEAWLNSYRPRELFDDAGTFREEFAALAPTGRRRMGFNPHANGGQLLQPLVMPRLQEHAVAVPAPGSVEGEATRVLGGFLREVMRLNLASANFRLFGPDETASNRLDAVYAVSGKAWMAETVAHDTDLSPNGRVMEVLSEHLCEGWLEGYLLTGRHGLFSCYEAFIHIIDSMFNQHAKWLKVSRRIPWRAPIASLNILLTSHVWRQDHNGLSHQDPGFMDHVANKSSDVVRIYLPPDANCLLTVADRCLRSRHFVNVIVAGKQPAWQWLDLDEAVRHCTAGAGVWAWAGNEGAATDQGPDVVMACAGDVPTLECLAAVMLLREDVPGIRIRVVNVVDLMALQPPSEHPHGLDDRDFDALFTTDRPVIFAFHGYPSLVHRLTYRRHNHANIHVRGFKEEGSTTTPFDMVVLNNLDRYQLALDAVRRIARLAGEVERATARYWTRIERHKRYIAEHGDDLPEVRGWRWQGSA